MTLLMSLNEIKTTSQNYDLGEKKTKQIKIKLKAFKVTHYIYGQNVKSI